MIYFIYNERKPTRIKIKKLKATINKIFEKANKNIGTVNYIFCSDDYLLNLNKQFLNHDTYTDIITFDLSNSKSTVDAEVYISLDRVKDNSVFLKTTLESETARVILHGALHLCGYKDKTKAAKITMRAKEEEFLRVYYKPKSACST